MQTTLSPPTIHDLLAHEAWTRRLALHLVKEPAAADDLVQETWRVALERPPREGGPLRPWIGTVMRNLLVSRHRTDGRRARREEAAHAGLEEASSDADPEQALACFQAHRLVSALVAELGEPYRQTVILRYFGGLESADIAARLGVAEGTVRWRIKTGLDELRARLDARHDGDRRRWHEALAPLVGAARAQVGPGAVAPAAAAGAAGAGAGWRAGAPGRGAPGTPRATSTGEGQPTGGIARAPIDPGQAARGAIGAAPAGLGRRTVSRSLGLVGAIAALGALVVVVVVVGARLVSPRVADGGRAQAGLTAAGETPGHRRAKLRPGLLAIPGGARLSGRVKDPQGAPAAGAHVLVYALDRLGRGGTHTRTDAEGRFEIPGLPPGRYLATARQDRRVSPQTPGELGAEGMKVPLELALLEAPALLSGEIADKGGGPVPRAMLGALERGSPIPGRSFMTEADENGRYELPLPPGAYTIFTAADGYKEFRHVVTATRRHVVKFKLSPTSVITGRIELPEGADADAVKLRTRQGDRWREVKTKVDPGGIFSFSGPEKGVLVVEAQLGALVGRVQRTIAAEDEVRLPPIPLASAASVSGRVTFALPQVPFPGLVTLGEAGGDDSYRTVPTGPDGAFRLDGIPPGRYAVVATPIQGSPSAAVEITVAAAPLEVALTTGPGAELAGRLTDERGRAVGGADVTVLPVGATRVYGLWMGRLGRLKSAPDGTFRVSGVPPGRVRVSGEAPGAGHAVVELDLADGAREAVALRLAPSRKVEGVVRWDDGTPAARASVRARDADRPDGKPEIVTADDEGRFVVGPFTGSATLEAKVAAKDGPCPGDHMTAPLVVDRRAPAAGVVLSLPRGGEVDGVVTDNDRPVAGVAIGCGDPAGPPLSTSGPDGKFRLTGVPSGRFRAWVRAPGQPAFEIRGRPGASKIELDEAPRADGGPPGTNDLQGLPRLPQRTRRHAEISP